jgi:ankyrin repeat protein
VQRSPQSKNFEGIFLMSQLINLIKKGASLSTIKTHLQSTAHVDDYINQQDNLGDTALLWATHKGKFSIVQLLIQHGADVNVGNIYGNTPLKYSVYQSIDFAQALLMAGAEVDAVNRTHGWSALRDAASLGFIEHVQLFLQFGATVDIVDNSGDTALDAAIKYHRFIDHNIKLASTPPARLLLSRQNSAKIIELLHKQALRNHTIAVA